MSSQITTAFVNQFSSNVQLLSQQRGSLLRGSVSEESVTGEKAFFDQVGATAAVKRTSRHQDTRAHSESFKEQLCEQQLQLLPFSNLS